MSDVDAIYYQNPFDLFDSYSTYFFHDFLWGQSSQYTSKKGILNVNIFEKHNLNLLEVYWKLQEGMHSI